MFSSTTTQFSLISGLSASILVESFFSSIIAGLFTVAMVTVFCWARTVVPVIRTAKRGMAKLFIFGDALVRMIRTMQRKTPGVCFLGYRGSCDAFDRFKTQCQLIDSCMNQKALRQEFRSSGVQESSAPIKMSSK